jgi:outer membrane murein-binding lipoprotein Lpp
MTSRSRIPGLAAVLATALVAGCGSSGPSKADFAKKADALCTQTNKANPPGAAPKTPKEASAQQAKEIQVRTDLDKKLRALDVPSSEKTDFDAYNAATQRIVGVIGRMKADADKKDQKAFTRDSQVFTKAARDRETTAVKLGFKVCGRRAPIK